MAAAHLPFQDTGRLGLDSGQYYLKTRTNAEPSLRKGKVEPRGYEIQDRSSCTSDFAEEKQTKSFLTPTHLRNEDRNAENIQSNQTTQLASSVSPDPYESGAPSEPT